jgi:hypothetical protein
MFRNAILNEVARCVHMPSNKALADSSRYNYSSGRLDHQTYYESIAVERSWWEIECLDRIFEWWLDEALMLDGFLPALDVMDFVPHVWRWPPNRDVDPKDQADANVLMIQNGLKTRAQYLLEQNIDPEQHNQQLIAEGWVDPNAVAAASALPPSAPGANATDATAETNATLTPDEPAPTGEFANMSRLQLNRNMKGIDDALGKVQTGEWSISRARIFLSALGLTVRTVDNLLREFETADVQVDSDG